MGMNSEEFDEAFNRFLIDYEPILTFNAKERGVTPANYLELLVDRVTTFRETYRNPELFIFYLRVTLQLDS